MAGADAEALLAAWERGRDGSPTHRALAMLAAGSSGTSSEQHAALPIGIRDQQLMRLREDVFGDAVSGASYCPACDEHLDVEFDLEDLMRPEPKADPTGTLVTSGYEVTYRAPTSADLLSVGDQESGVRARSDLLERCVEVVRRDGEESSPDELPRDVVDELSRALVNADPGAQVELALTCPSCANAWPEVFDIASYLWSELDVWAQRTLREVHELASAYGWNEREILVMPTRRRRSYLELIGT